MLICSLSFCVLFSRPSAFGSTLLFVNNFFHIYMVCQAMSCLSLPPSMVHFVTSLSACGVHDIISQHIALCVLCRTHPQPSAARVTHPPTCPFTIRGNGAHCSSASLASHRASCEYPPCHHWAPCVGSRPPHALSNFLYALEWFSIRFILCMPERNF